MTRFALYARVSSERQEREETIQSQLHALRAFADRQDAEIVPDAAAQADVFADDGFTGADLNRPALDRLRALVRAKAIDALAVYDLDRLSRDEADLYALHKELATAGIVLWVAKTGQPFEDTDEGRILFTVYGMLGRLERGKIRDRARRGLKERARREQRTGGGIPSFGFDAQDGHYVLNLAERDWCRQMRTWLIDGVTPGRIAQMLMERQVPTKYDSLGITRRDSHRQRATWYPDQVRRILTHELYGGTYRHHAWDGETVEIAVPAIFTRAEIDEHRTIISRNRSVKKRSDTQVNLLRGLVRCGECGRRYVAGRASQTANYQRIYRCGVWHRPKTLRDCTNKSWTANRLEGAVWDAVAQLLTDPSLVIAGLRARGEDPDHPTLRVEQLTRSLNRLDAEDERIRTAFRAGMVYTAEQAAEELDKSEQARRVIHKQLAELEHRVSQDDQTVALATLTERFRDRLPHATPEQKAAILREVVERITVTGDRIELEVLLPPVPAEIDPKNGTAQAVPLLGRIVIAAR